MCEKCKKKNPLSRLLALSQFLSFIWASPLGFNSFSPPHCRLQNGFPGVQVTPRFRHRQSVQFHLLLWAPGSPTIASVHLSTHTPVCPDAVPLLALRQWEQWSPSDESFLLKTLFVSSHVRLFDNSHWFHRLGGKKKAMQSTTLGEFNRKWQIKQKRIRVWLILVFVWILPRVEWVFSSRGAIVRADGLLKCILVLISHHMSDYFHSRWSQSTERSKNLGNVNCSEEENLFSLFSILLIGKVSCIKIIWNLFASMYNVHI